MNTLRNKVQLIGRLGGEPEIVTFQDGNKMAKFSMATDDSYKDKEGTKVERAYWHNVVVRGGLVSVVENYVKKGQEIACMIVPNSNCHNKLIFNEVVFYKNTCLWRTCDWERS